MRSRQLRPSLPDVLAEIAALTLQVAAAEDAEVVARIRAKVGALEVPAALAIAVGVNGETIKDAVSDFDAAAISRGKALAVKSLTCARCAQPIPRLNAGAFVPPRTGVLVCRACWNTRRVWLLAVRKRAAFEPADAWGRAEFPKTYVPGVRS